MTTIASLMVQIDLQIEEIERLETEYAKLIGDLIDLCPVKIDAIVPVTDGSHKGKSMLVSKIEVVGSFRGRKPRAYRISGKIIHKNGSMSRLNGTFEISLKEPTL